MLQSIRRPNQRVASAAAILVAAWLQSCTFIPPLNETNVARIVYGVSDRTTFRPYGNFGPAGVSVPVAKVDQGSGTVGCNAFETSAWGDQRLAGVLYWVFDVPPGAYGFRRGLSPSPVFVALAGKTVYLGDYLVDEANTVMFRRDLETAKLALGKIADEMELAMVVPNVQLTEYFDPAETPCAYRGGTARSVASVPWKAP